MQRLESFSDRCLVALPFVTMMGLIGLAATALLGFEEPHALMLIVASVCLAAAPAGLAIHLTATTQLTAEEKRRWWAALMSWRGLTLFPAYFVRKERAAATQNLAEAGRPRC
jgi:hypothetical protein